MSAWDEPLIFPKGTIVELHMKGADVFRGRSELSQAFAAAIADWSWAEHWYANLRAMLNLNDPEFDMSKFKIEKTTQPEKRLLEEARKKLQDELRAKLLDRAILKASMPATARNDLAHGLLAYCPLRPNDLIVFKQESLRQAFRSGLATVIFDASFENMPGEEVEEFYREFLMSGRVWTRTHLDRLSEASLHSAEILRVCCNLCSHEPKISEGASRWLTSHLSNELRE